MAPWGSIDEQMQEYNSQSKQHIPRVDVTEPTPKYKAAEKLTGTTQHYEQEETGPHA